MVELTMEHLNAVCHAEFYINKAAAKFLEPRMHAQVEDDLLRLAELKMHILRQMSKSQGLLEQESEGG